MDSRRIRNLRNSFDKNIVDKQVDKIFETGRQFVDGVSGARPGKRRNSDFQGITSKSVKKVGRWVSEKVDLFFDEDNDDWNDENFYDDNRDIKTFSRESNSYESAKQHSKRPLEAISLRQPKNLHNIFYRQYSLSFSYRKISHHNFGKFLYILILSFQ